MQFSSQFSVRHMKSQNFNLVEYILQRQLYILCIRLLLLLLLLSSS